MAGLGWTPYYEDINLRTGQDWILEIPREEGPIAPATVAEVKWANGTTWAGSIDGDTLVFRVESTQADLIPNGTAYILWVRYPNSATSTTDDYQLFAGKARRDMITVRTN